MALWGGAYSRAAFISLDVALWGSIYLRAVFIRVNTVLLIRQYILHYNKIITLFFVYFVYAK